MPTIVDLMPSGRFLMEDFYYAGGLPVVLRALDEAGLLNRDALTVNGRTIGENNADAENFNAEVIRPLDKPLTPDGGIMVLRGNLVPGGAVIKPSAATPALMQHRGRAVVFENIEHYHETDRRPRSRHRRDLRDGAQELRPARLSRHGRGRQHGPAAEAPEEGRSPTWCASPTRG